MRSDHFHIAAFRDHNGIGTAKTVAPDQTAAVSRSYDRAIDRAESHAPQYLTPRRSKRLAVDPGNAAPVSTIAQFLPSLGEAGLQLSTLALKYP